MMTGSGAEVIEMVRNHSLSIGFCRLSDITDESGENLAEGIALLPVDLNENGTLDYFEEIYADPETLERGIWIGKYPRSLVTNIYAISAEAPVDEAQTAFLKWVVTGGQDYLGAGSLAALNPNERYSKIAGLTTATTEAVSVSQAGSAGRTILIVGVLLAGVIFISFSISWFIRKGEEEVSLKPFPPKGMMDEESVAVPGGLFYDRTHTWAFMERSGEVRVGIDDFLQKVTGRVTRVIMKKPGERISRGEKAITIIQDGKQLVVYSPVSGVVRKTNEELMEYAGMINSSPYSEGWVYLVEPENWAAEVARMRDAGKYRTWLKEEFARMRDFLSSLMNSGQLTGGIVLQDGGEIAENVLNNLDPVSWEEFQTRFIDTSR
jgi:glycine cleavage system H lipoate-binding protein